ncbi:MAG: hypothetical protein KF861_17125 [Planctomycetaceae bacterium]|nr:hypothetical protein [Planctomycetaceae bacterium]
MLSHQIFSPRSSSAAAALCGSFLTLMMAGCGGSAPPPWETVYPATGVVTYRGKPVANADIVLFPQDETFPDTVRPRAKSTEDGTFSVWTWQRGDGAPAGNYKATIVHNEIVISNGAMGAKPNDLPRKYSQPDTTDLIVRIDPESNQIPPLELK